MYDDDAFPSPGMRLVPVRARHSASGGACEGHGPSPDTVSKVARKSSVEVADVSDDDTHTARARPVAVATTASRPRFIGPANSKPRPNTTPPSETGRAPAAASKPIALVTFANAGPAKASRACVDKKACATERCVGLDRNATPAPTVHQAQPRSRQAPFRVDRLTRIWSRRQDPRLQVQAALATVFALALYAFLHVVEDYLDREAIVRWDVEFSRWLHVHSDGALVSFFKLVTWAGNVATLAVVVLAAALWLVRRRRVNEAVLLAVSAAGIELFNAGFKLVVHRPRPELAYVHLDTYSFPSGHAAGSAAIYGVILYLLASQARDLRVRVALGIGYVALIALICFSRLYLEVHYLSDVLAGASLGAAWAAGSLFIYEVKRDGDVGKLLPARLTRALDRLAV
jgi:membrane-associated phospholipid phosphatase